MTAAVIDGYILAGGSSSRMGTDKAALRLGGLTFVEHVAAALRSVAREVIVISSKHEGELCGLPVFPDLHQNHGPLGGLFAALTHSDGARAAVVSCDLPFVTGELMRRLASYCSEDWDAVVPVQEDGRAQPLCAIYEAKRCRTVTNLLLNSGERRPRELLARVRTRRVAFDELADLDGAALFFVNVNTPEEYERAREAAGG